MHNQTNELFALWDTGLTLQQIADKYGVSRAYIQQIVSKHPDYNPQARLEARNNSIKNYYLNRPEFKMVDIARIHRVSLSTAEKVCRDLPGRYTRHNQSDYEAIVEQD